MHSRDIASGCALLPARAAGAWPAVGQAPFTFPLCPWARPLAAGSTVDFLPSPWPACDPGPVPSSGRALFLHHLTALHGYVPTFPIPFPGTHHRNGFCWNVWIQTVCVCGEKPSSSPWRANFLTTHPVSSALPASEPCCKPRLLVSLLLVSSGIKLIMIDILIDCINTTRHQVTCTRSL